MATHDYVIANGSGAAVRADINGVLSAIVSNNSSATEPTTTYAYMWWADTTAGQLKIRNSTDTDWVVINELDGTSLMEDGTVSAPGLAFADDLNTGFYRPGADQLAIATNGIERVEFGTTEVVFNDGGEDIDFRVEGDTNANLFFVDAGNDRVGIGTASPDVNLTIKDVSAGGTGGALRLLNATTTIGSKASLLFTTTTNETYESARIDAERASTGTHLVFSSNAIERARIDNSGRLLVGTSSDTGVAKLTVQGYTGGPSGEAILSLRRDATPGAAGTTLGVINYYNSANSLGAQIFAVSDGAWTNGVSHPTYIGFGTCASGTTTVTQRMRITSAGFAKHTSTGTFIDSTGSYHEFRSGAYDTAALHIDHASSSPYGLFIRYSGAAPDNNTNYFIRGADTIFSRFTVYSDGDVVTSDQGTLTSDATLKRDITDATPKLADVMNLKVRNYYWKEDYHPNKQNKLIGFIAQEFEEIFPGLVTEHEIKEGEPILDEEGNDTGEKTPGVYKKCIREGKLIPILVKALQEAVERIETLEAKVAALESA